MEEKDTLFQMRMPPPLIQKITGERESESIFKRGIYIKVITAMLEKIKNGEKLLVLAVPKGSPIVNIHIPTKLHDKVKTVADQKKVTLSEIYFTAFCEYFGFVEEAHNFK